MLISLAKAPIGVPLVLGKISDPGFAARLGRLGLAQGTALMRISDGREAGPVKVRGTRGEAVLSGGLAAKVIMRLDDGRRLPLLECGPGEAGHVEGLTGHERRRYFSKNWRGGKRPDRLSAASSAHDLRGPGGRRAPHPFK